MIKRTMMPTLTLMGLTALLACVLSGPASAQEDPPGFAGPPDEAATGPGPGWGHGGRGPMGPGRGGFRGFGGMGPGGHGPEGLHLALRELDLSESQREEIRTIFESERDQVQAQHERMRARAAELEVQIESDPSDAESVRAKATAVAALGVEMAVHRASQVGRVRAVLTPEQLTELERMKAERQAFRDERREHFEGRRGPRAKP